MSAGDQQIQDGLDAVARMVLDPSVILREGQGQAYQVVAHACALTVQDASDWLRNFTILANAANGRLLADFVQTQNPEDLLGIAAILEYVQTAATTFETVSNKAAAVLRDFPHGA